MSVEKIADAGACTSILLCVSAKALEWMPILQALSLFVAIVAGVFAICVHLKKLLQ